MEYVILILALPFAIVAVALTFSHRQGSGMAPALMALSVSAPVATSRLARKILPGLVTVGIAAAAFLVLSRSPFCENLVRLMALSRYGLLSGLLLVWLVPLGLQAFPGLLANLFVLRSPRQLFHIAWMSVLVGATAIVVCRVEELNACAPYRVSELHVPDQGREWVRLAALLVLCLPLLLACGRCSREAFFPPEQWRWAPWLLAGVTGLAFGLLLVVLAAAGQDIFLSPRVIARELFPLQTLANGLWRALGAPHTDLLYPAGDWLARVVNGAGYSVEAPDGTRHMAPGHLQAGAGMLVVLVVYLGHYLTVKALGVHALRRIQMPSLFLLLLLVLLLGFFLQGAAFALDRFWIPAALAMLLFAFAVYQVWRTDHLFSLGHTRAAGGVQVAAARITGPNPELKDAIPAWQRQTPRTLVAVTASGGGIQAAGWTARVLVGLNELYGDPFTRSIRLLSAVSGGSVGAMYAMDAWPPAQTPEWQWPAGMLPADDSVCGRAMASSLEATAWGIVFPDLLRAVAPLLVARTDDRGARIEEAWRGHLRHPQARMRAWSEPSLHGDMPIALFNATVVETGQRFIASPVLVPQQHLPPAIRARQLLELYPDADPLVSTMVRLSATFPYVSPICRPERAASDPWPESVAYHFADGGYVDNEGMVTVIDALMSLLDHDRGAGLPFERVLLVRLMPFPSTQAAPASLDRGWFYATLGPIDAIENVRTASQQERNDLAVRLFRETAAARNVEVRSVELRYELPGAAEPPLSWMLTSPQKLAIDRAWRALAGAERSPLAKIDEWFPRRGH